MNSPAQPSPYGRGHRALEIASITFAFGSLSWIAYRIAAAAHGVGDWIGITMAAVFGYIVSDFLSGFVHWAGDTVGDESTPILGRTSCGRSVTTTSIRRTSPGTISSRRTATTASSSPVLMLVLFLLPETTGVLFYTCVVIACTALFVFCTNQFHKWAHTRTRPVDRLLQRAGLILSPEHHVIHHTAPRDKYYCITVGWMNPVLEKIASSACWRGDRAHPPARPAPAPGRPPSEGSGRGDRDTELTDPVDADRQEGDVRDRLAEQVERQARVRDVEQHRADRRERGQRERAAEGRRC